MIGKLVEQVVTEMKSHPFTMVAVLGLLGFSSYAALDHANAADVKALEAKVDRVLTLQLSESIRSLAVQLCSMDDSPQKRALERALDSAREDYRDITGTTFPAQDCSQ